MGFNSAFKGLKLSTPSPRKIVRFTDIWNTRFSQVAAHSFHTKRGDVHCAT